MRRCILFVFILIVSVVVYGTNDPKNEKPFTIPEIKEWEGGYGVLPLIDRTLYCNSDDEKIKSLLSLFISDYKKMFGHEITGTVHKEDTLFVNVEINDEADLGDEGYIVIISDDIEIRSASAVGLHWALQSILQILEKSNGLSLPKGIVKDYPDYQVRGMLMDCARKFIPISFLKDYIRILSYYKMNTLHLHLNDNGLAKFFGGKWENTYSAFRLESEYFPGLASTDGHYTKKEFVELQKYANNLGVNIIPEIDVPAHSLAFTKYRPELASKYGMNYLDMFSSKTYSFVDSLFEEYIGGKEPVFIGKQVHIGTDEYRAAKSDTVKEKFRYFTNRYINYVEKFGKQACVWGALSAADGTTKVKSDNVIMHIWHNPFANPKKMVDDGFKIINIPERNYITPLMDYYADYIDCRKLYDEWSPVDFGEYSFYNGHPAILGGMFAVWNDGIGNGISLKDIHDRSFPVLRIISLKTWQGESSKIEYDEFYNSSEHLCEAPGVNISAKIGSENSLVFSYDDELKKIKFIPFKEIGYDYTVEFKIDGVQEKKGTELFVSDNAVFYLSDPVNGKLGFSREGYNYTFNCSVSELKNSKVAICGDSKGTKLYVNNKLIDHLSIIRLHYNDSVSMRKISTLVFPLKKVEERYKSKISGLKVFNYQKYR